MKYILVKHPNQIDFITHVERYLSEGWTPIGGVSYTHDNCYLQALIKK